MKDRYDEILSELVLVVRESKLLLKELKAMNMAGDETLKLIVEDDDETWSLVGDNVVNGDDQERYNDVNVVRLDSDGLFTMDLEFIDY